MPQLTGACSSCKLCCPHAGAQIATQLNFMHIRISISFSDRHSICNGTQDHLKDQSHKLNLLLSRAELFRVTCSVDKSSPAAFTGTSVPTNALVIRGVATTAARVETVVMATLSGTSALARNVTTLDATPPGHAATMHILQQPGT